MKWNEHVQRKFSEEADEKGVIVARDDRKRLNLLDTLKIDGI